MAASTSPIGTRSSSRRSPRPASRSTSRASTVTSGRAALMVLVLSALVVVCFMEVSRTHITPLVSAHGAITTASAAAGLTSANLGSADDMQDLARRRLLIPVEGVDRARLRDNFEEMHGGHRHEALDIMAARGTPGHAGDSGRAAQRFGGKRARPHGLQ